MVLRELLSPTDLPRAQAFDIYKLLEIVMVIENENLIFAVFQIMVQVLNAPTMAKSS